MRTLSFLLLGFVYATARADYQHFEARQVHPLTMTPDGTRLVAVDSSNARVTVFDLASGMPVRAAQIPVGLEPVTARARTHDEVWVVNEVGDSVSILSLATSTVVDTLRVGDEPTDVVFAAGKAFVACARDNQIRVFDAQTRAPLATISAGGLYPHALAVNEAGTRLYAAFLLSGNGTTVIRRQAAPDQPAPTNPALPAAPDTALIVPVNDPRVTNIIVDRDVVEIDTATHAVVRHVSGVGTNLFDIAARPGAGQVWVTNTEALNLTRFEPALRGHFADNRVSILTADAVSIVDLNPGVNYGLLPNPAAQASALAQPSSLVFSADGSALWVAAFASDRVARLDPATGAVAARVDIRTGADTDSSAMRGPRGLVWDEARGQLYVLNKLSSTVSVIDTQAESVVGEVRLSSYDPMPQEVRAGRGYLFDARLSGNGTVSCGTCHMDADRDGLAWDLGDPGGSLLTVMGANLSVHDLTKRPRVMHPMKGPMVTQTLRGMQNGAPFHWRGDKPTLQSFNSTFDNLMGGSQIDADDMDDLAAYLVSLVHHSNPNRNLDRSLPASVPGMSGNPETGRTHFNSHTKSHCAVCHLLPEGSDHNIDLPQESGLSQPVKTPPLRTTYQRLFFDARAGTTSFSGFGLLHDGTGGTASLPTVHPYVLDQLETAQEFADVTAFIRCFDTGTAKTVGYSRTVTAANRADAAVLADIALLEARAVARLVDCDVIARGRVGGVDRNYFWTGTAYQGETEAAGLLSRAALLASLGGNDSLTFMGVLPDSGPRLSVDEDEDIVLNGDDPQPGVVNGPPKILSHPQNLAVAPGAPATLSVRAAGLGLSYQWKRGTTNVGTNSPTLSIASATTADNGSYTVVITNVVGSRTSNAASLKVVLPPVITTPPVSRTVNEGATVSFSVTATGSNLSYKWKRGTTEIDGVNKSTLMLVGVGALDVGSYSVTVSNGDMSVSSDPVTLSVNLWPVMNDLDLPPAIIGQDYAWTLKAVNNPARFNASGLPAGLKLDPSTGIISGRPTTAKKYTVKASATNTFGTGLAREQELTVQPYPASALGSYLGHVPRHEDAALNQNLGGRLTLTTTKLGAFSGTLQLGAASYPFREKLVMRPDADPTGSVTIPRKNSSALTLNLTLRRSSRSLACTVSDGSRTLDVYAFLPEDEPAVYAGNYTLALKPPASGDAPRGHGIGAFKISTKGAISGALRLADGIGVVALSGLLREGGRLPVFTLLYSRQGSLLGDLEIGSGGVLDASALSWFKHRVDKGRSYPAGFGPLALTTVGRPYVIPPQDGIALGLDAGAGNARLVFTDGGAPSPETRLNWASFEIRPGNPAKILPPSNPGLVKLSITPGRGTAFTPGSTGAFSGSFKLTDPDTSTPANKPLARSASFRGMIVDDGTGRKGYGFFNLAEMPAAGPPKTTATTTLQLSGAVLLDAAAR